LGGHIVQGHVDGTGTIAGVHEEGFARVLDIEIDARPPQLADAAPPQLARYLVGKGSVAVDGVSLTVSEVRNGGFSVSLIPETLARTSLGEAQVGDRVNLEADVLAKHVERLLKTEARV
ncbi:MAG: hypothetical protein WAN93_13975, partial [Solirubrobacteraceae bacterium]